MASIIEYAALAAHVYNDQRGGGGDTLVNHLATLPGWKALGLLGFSTGDYLNINPFSFTANAYINGSGEIVIAYKGTDFLTAAEGRSWNTVADIAADVGLATTIANLNIGQQLYASSYYLAVKQWAVDNGYSANNISFTGHSLGGGLASNMAVWFDKPATTFAEGPFQAGAVNSLAITAAAAALTLQAGATASQSTLAEILVLKNAMTDFSAREAAVTNYYVKGEFLGYLRASATTVVGDGKDKPIDIGDRPFSSKEARDLHSMNLHLALLLEPRLVDLIKKQPDLVPAFFDGSLYFADPNSTRQDFMTKLVADQLTGPISRQTGLLGRFTSDLQKIAAADGTSSLKDIQKGLIAAAMDYYYLNDPSTVTSLFSTSNGGIHFDDADIPGDKAKSLPLLAEAVSKLDDKSAHFIRSYAQDATGWHIQSGTGALNWTASSSDNQAAIGGAESDSTTGGDGDDMLIGLEGADTLQGKAGSDLLVGGDGADQLDGGEGLDYLYGGAGSDTYAFTGDFGNDWINDSDGSGQITVDGQTLSAQNAKKVSTNTYKDKSTGWTFFKGDVQTDGTATLVISKEGARNSSITVRNWKSGQMGINLSDTQEEAPTGLSVFKGDQRPLIYGVELIDDSEPIDTYAWTKVSWNTVDGTLQGQAKAEADFADVFYGTDGGDDIQGLGGNDALNGGAGKDKIDGGNGNDLIGGGSGSDTILGGAGRDEILSAHSVNVPQRKSPTDKWTVPPEAKSVIISGPTWGVYDLKDKPDFYIISGAGSTSDDQPDYIDGGAGDDRIFGSHGNDYVNGGDDNDVIDGLAGADLLYGGAGDDHIVGDSIIKPNFLTTTAAELHGNDLLDGGTGNDTLFGQGGKDLLFGGDNDDKLWGDTTEENFPVVEHDEDTLDGGTGNDLIIGGGKNDLAHGGVGNDSLWGDDAVDRLETSVHGDDTLDGGIGDDQLIGGGRNDLLIGDAGKDKLWGDGSSDEVPEAAHGKDTLQGGLGNDELVGGGDADLLIGGDDGDKLWGDDSGTQKIDVAFHGTDYLDGGKGDDQLIGGGKDDSLIGGDGADNLWGDGTGQDVDVAAHGTDFLSGGLGQDQLIGGGEADELHGGEDNDLIYGDDVESSVSASAHGNDALYGNEGLDTLIGGGKDDTLFGGNGNDTLRGDDVSSKLGVAAHGKDQLYGGDGGDQLIGGGSDDQLFGGIGADVLVGDDLVASVAGGAHGSDTLDGGADNDTIFGDGGNDILLGGSGDDFLAGEHQTSTAATAQSSTLQGDDLLMGEDGNDVLLGGEGNDTLDGGADNDILVGGAGADEYRFGVGHGLDTVNLESTDSTADTIQLEAGLKESDISFSRTTTDLTLSINGTTDQLILQGFFTRGVDIIQFGDGLAKVGNSMASNTFKNTDGADTLIGYAQGERISGGGGGDQILGNAGDDTLDGGTGNDVLQGGVGADIYTFGMGSGQDTVNNQDTDAHGVRPDAVHFASGVAPSDVQLSRSNDDLIIRIIGTDDSLRIQGYFTSEATTSQAVEYLQFAGGQTWDIAAVKLKVLDPTNGNDFHRGYTSNDTIHGAGGNDTIYGYAGNDSLDGGLGADNLQGGDNDDVLSGGSGSDLLLGGNGADRLLGGEHYDTLRGEAGNDILDGGLGNDSLEGGLGADVYRFELGSGQDTILNQDQDVLGTNLDTLLIGAGIAPDDVSLGRADNDLIVQIKNKSDNVRVQRFFDSEARTSNAIDVIKFANDVTWDVTAIKNKVLTGTVFNDYLQGYSSNDTISGADGNDAIFGNAGRDDIDGGEGADALSGGDHDDIIKGGLSDDTLWGGAGADTLEGGAGQDRLDGGAGSDVYRFGRGSGQDTVIGLERPQVSGVPIDTILLGAGLSMSDLNLIASNNDLVIGIKGTEDSLRVKDYFLAGESAYSHLPLVVKFADGGTWGIANFADGMGAGKQRLIGTGTDDALNGGQGDDYLWGGDGADSLDGGSGNDLLHGGSGSDTYEFGVGSGQDTIDNVDADAAGSYPDTVRFGTGITTGDVILSRKDNGLLIQIKNTDDSLWIKDQLKGSARSTAGVDFMKFASGANWDAATIATQVLLPTNDNDSLEGYDVADELKGGKGRDTLRGGNGNDTLDGGADDDWLSGEAGSDTYKFGLGSGQDTISDIGTDADVDTLLLGPDIKPEDISLVQGSGHLILYIKDAAERAELNSIERIEFSGGLAWDQATINSRIAATSTVNDTIHGSASPEVIDGGVGDDSLIGSEGNDVLRGGSGRDVLLGGTVEEHQLGGGDFVVTNTKNDTLEGGGGGDRLFGGEGDDRLDGGLGNDFLYGYSGSDTYFYRLGDGSDTINNDVYTAFDSADEDVILFDSSIKSTDVHMYRIGSELVIGFTNSPDHISVESYFKLQYSNSTYDTPNPNAVDFLEFSSGERWDFSEVLSRLIAFTSDAAEYALVQSQGDATLNGLGGNDTLNGNNGNNRIDGGTGNDWLYGIGGNDTLVGGPGDDTLNDKDDDNEFDGGAGNDVLIGGAGHDTFLFGLGSGRDTITARDGDTLKFAAGISPNDLRLTSATDNSELVITINGADDRVTLVGFFPIYYSDDEPENVSFEFFGGTVWSLATIKSKLLDPTEFNDTLIGYPTDDLINGGAGDDSVYGNGGVNKLDGGTGNDYLFGRELADTLSGGQGIDTLYGGWGADFYIVDQRDDIIIEVDESSFDRVESSASYALSNHVEGLTLKAGAAQALEAEGNALANELQGNEFGNRLLGKEGNDSLWGFAGGDSLVGGEGADFLDGGAGDDSLYGNAGADVYAHAKGEGRDSVFGNRLEDTLKLKDVTSTSDVRFERDMDNLELVIMNGGSEISRVVLVNLALDGAAVYDGVKQIEFDDEAKTVWDLATIRTKALTGTAQDNTNLRGYASNDSLSGLSGSDALHGEGGSDTLEGGAGQDALYGGADADTYIYNKGDGHDIIYGQRTDDTLAMKGFKSTDVTFSRQLSDINIADITSGVSRNLATLINQAFDGTHEFTGVSQIIFDDKTLTAEDIRKSALRGTSNSDANLRGYATNDNINGVDGDDSLYGEGGDDQLIGGSGNDLLDGGNGTDTLIGGAGNDTYVVDTSLDMVMESSGEGSDTIQTSISYVAPDHVERMNATGSSDTTLTANNAGMILLGNTGNNQLIGGTGADRLYSSTGNDTLIGGLGNDLYYISDLNDAIVERANEGADIVFSFVDNIVLASGIETLNMVQGRSAFGNNEANKMNGNSGNNVIEGNSGFDNIKGGGGNDVLRGGAQRDNLGGGAGNDTYVMAVGDGVDFIFNEDALGHDVLMFEGVSEQQLWFSQTAIGLNVSVMGQSTGVNIVGWQSGAANQVDEIKVGNTGKTLSASKVSNLIQVMSTMVPPAANQTSLSAAQQAQLAPVLAANWV